MNILSLRTQFGSFEPPVENKFTRGSATGRTAFDNLEVFVSNLIGIITILGAVFFVINFIIGAFNWISSGGDSGKIEAARNKMTHSAIGLVIIVAAYGIIGVIGTAVGLDLLNPAVMLNGLVDRIL